MTPRTDTHYAAVDRDEVSAPFFDAAARGELVVRSCPSGHLSPPESLACTSCRSLDLGWSAVAGTGALVTWIVVPGREAEGVTPPPKIAASVELDEGPWVTTALVAVDPATLHTGMRLRAEFIAPDGGEVYPVFGPA